ncbi:MAG: PHP domain-containing protein [Anaerolineae bacterium]|nr:PHP domain-containing protein [Anaerolineae bacterium]
MTLLRLDLHTHSRYSYDSFQSLDAIIRAVRGRGLDGIALTDHDVLEGALELDARAGFRVIPGEEIRTSAGEITGLFLHERIPPGLSPQETIKRIRAQGGLVYVPHPLARGVPSRIRRAALDEMLPYVDIVEGFNARVPLGADDVAAQRLAASCNLAVGAGSDAHFPFEFGRGWVEIEDFATPEEFLANLRRGRIVGERKTPYYVAGTTYLTKRVKLLLRALKRKN